MTVKQNDPGYEAAGKWLRLVQSGAQIVSDDDWTFEPPDDRQQAEPRKRK